MELMGRNEKCWCGSGKKYKQCHLAFDEKIVSFEEQGIPVPPREIIKTPEQIEGIRRSGIVNTAILDLVAEKIHQGMSTEEINTLVHNATIAQGAIPATLGYMGFPKSVCTSINDVVCHGIPSEEEILKEGDIVNIDVTTILNGYFADASRMFYIGQVEEDKRRLVEKTKECLRKGLEAARPWGRLGDIGAAVQTHAEENGYSVVRDIGGHGVGNEFHEEPYVSHLGEAGTGMLLVPGMVFTIEPMINMGTGDYYEDEINGWTIRTRDGRPSAQWEYTVLITEDGNEILTY